MKSTVGVRTERVQPVWRSCFPTCRVQKVMGIGRTPAVALVRQLVRLVIRTFESEPALQSTHDTPRLLSGLRF
jgi:hypothetical protein